MRIARTHKAAQRSKESAQKQADRLAMALRIPSFLVVFFLLVAGVFFTGCAGHEARTKSALDALDAGKASVALEKINNALGVSNAGQYPTAKNNDAAILVLDRSMILMHLEEYALASKDFEYADKQIELLDFARSTTDDVARYLFSDDSGPYKAPPYEKLMINTMNMVSYLVRGDLQGARVEARRLAVIQKYLESQKASDVSLTSAGSYLAGFVFEKSGDPQEALRFYDEALQHNSYNTLVQPITRLSKIASYRTKRIRSIIGEEDSEGATALSDSDESPDAPTTGELLVVIAYGRVPAKHAVRIPIGMAISISESRMTPEQRSQAARIEAKGAVTWINYPELGKPRGAFARPSVYVDNNAQRVEGILDVDIQSKKAWEESKGVVIASAITRMITRAVAGEITEQLPGVRQSNSLVKLLANLVTQAAMVAIDTPDTRCWATLPARIAFSRLRLPAGKHAIELTARGTTKRKTVQIKPNGWTVVGLTVLH